uniref:Uncharacterized protein n=1 Tax=Arundo donax TaxID=35708 RepID=A0A0A9ET24_ARUDO
MKSSVAASFLKKKICFCASNN